MLWLVNWGWQCIRAGRSRRWVTRKRPRDMRSKRSDLDRVRRIGSGDRHPIIGVSDFSDDTTSKWVQVFATTSPRKKIRDKKKSSLWVYFSPPISQTNNKLCAPFENEMRDICFLIPCSSLFINRFPWCNGYRRRKWTRRQKFKSWTRLIAFHIALIPLGKVWIQLFSLQLWVNSRTDWVLQLGESTSLGEGKLWIQTC